MADIAAAPTKFKRPKVIAAVLAVLAILAFKIITPDPHDKGDAAYLAKNYAEAFKVWAPLAEKGYARAQYDLGLLYANGFGLPQNNVTAVYRYRKSADQGYVQAQYNIGVMFYNAQAFLRTTRLPPTGYERLPYETMLLHNTFSA